MGKLQYHSQMSRSVLAANVDNMKSWGIWLTVLMRGAHLNLLTRYPRDTTPPIFYIMC